MKTLFVSLAALLFAFFVGCQDNITDPVVNDSGNNALTLSAENYVSKDIIHAFPGVIKLSGKLFDPSQTYTSYVSIRGIVRYNLEQVLLKQRPPKTAIKVGLWVNAELTGSSTASSESWTVKGTAEEIVYTSTDNQPVYYIEKSFKVQNTSPMLDLVLKFRVDEKNLELVSMRLFVNEY